MSLVIKKLKWGYDDREFIITKIQTTRQNHPDHARWGLRLFTFHHYLFCAGDLMIKVVFISVLILTTKVPPEGWLQWTQSYSDVEICHERIREDFDQISSAVKGYLGKKFVSVLEMRCLTYDQAVKLNAELGH